VVSLTFSSRVRCPGSPAAIGLSVDARASPSERGVTSTRWGPSCILHRHPHRAVITFSTCVPCGRYDEMIRCSPDHSRHSPAMRADQRTFLVSDFVPVHAASRPALSEICPHRRRNHSAAAARPQRGYYLDYITNRVTPESLRRHQGCAGGLLVSSSSPSKKAQAIRAFVCACDWQMGLMEHLCPANLHDHAAKTSWTVDL